MIKFLRDRFMLAKFKKQDLQRTKELELFNELAGLLTEKGITKFDKLLNVCMYSSLVSRDIYYLCEYYYFEKNHSRKNFYGRLLCMTIIEFLENISHLLGKELKEELEKNHMDEFVEDIKQINKLYANIRKDYSAELKEIRNNAAAHKNIDAKYLYKFHIDFPIDNLSEIGYKMGVLESYFIDITTKISELLPDAVSEAMKEGNDK